MFKLNPEHLFECFYPRLPETLEFKKHYKYPILISKEGICQIDPDSDYTLAHYKTSSKLDYPNNIIKAIGLIQKSGVDKWKKAKRLAIDKLIYETFFGIGEKFTVMLKLNYNPYDSRACNLIPGNSLTNDERVAYKKGQEIFISNTVNEMIKREKTLPPDINLGEYWERLGIPILYINKWNKVKGLEDNKNIYIKKYKGVYYRGNNKWIAFISFNSKRFYLGYHDSPELANLARLNFKRKLINPE